MTNVYTEHSVVKGEVSVWAIPDFYASKEGPAFKYELRTDKPWATGAVKVVTVMTTVPVPAGINLVAKAVATLREAKDDAHRDYIEKLQGLDKQISNLLMLTGPTVGGDSDQEGGDGVLEGEIG